MTRRIAAMGDSITAAGWPGMLAALTGDEVTNRGQNGAVTADGVEDVRGVLAVDRPDVLLVSYGLNDVAWRLEPATILKNLRVIVRTAKTHAVEPVVATLTPVFYPFDELADDAAAVSEHIRALGASEGIRIADVEAAFNGDHALISADGIHPNRGGLRRIAQVFDDLLAQGRG